MVPCPRCIPPLIHWVLGCASALCNSAHCISGSYHWVKTLKELKSSLWLKRKTSWFLLLDGTTFRNTTLHIWPLWVWLLYNFVSFIIPSAKYPSLKIWRIVPTEEVIRYMMSDTSLHRIWPFSTPRSDSTSLLHLACQMLCQTQMA